MLMLDDYFTITFFSYSNVMIAATTIVLAFLLIWLVGAKGFASLVNKQEVESIRKSLEALSNDNSIKRGWKDLAPPFNQQSSHTEKDWKHEQEDVTHFCFLVHGHRGYSKVRAKRSRVFVLLILEYSFSLTHYVYLMHYRIYHTYKQ